MPSKSSNKKNKKNRPSSKTSSSTSSSGAKIPTDAKKLAREFPDIAAKLRNGTMKPGEVPDAIRKAKEKEAMVEFDKLYEILPKKAVDGIKNGRGSGKVARLGSLEIMTGAEHGLCDLVRAAVGADDDLSHRFAWEFFGGRHECPWKNVKDMFGKDGAIKPTVGPESLAILSEIHQSYIKTCENLRPQIQKLARKPFREHCWAYKDSYVEFIAVLGQIIDESENYSLEKMCRDLAHTKVMEVGPEIKVAAQGIVDGHDQSRHVCWECGKSGKVFKCSCCEAARYCSKECQRKSWIDGHKQACDELKPMYASFMNNYRQVKEHLDNFDKEHPFGIGGRGIPPAGTMDFVPLSMMLHKRLFPVELTFDIVKDGAISMENFYKNLDSIVNGRRHWMFEETFEGTMKDFVSGRSIQKPNNCEMDYIMHGMLFLTIDLLKFPNLLMMAQSVSLFRLQLGQVLENGELMSVNRFVEIYFGLGHIEREGYAPNHYAQRSQFTTRALRVMMKFFHKKKGPLDIIALHNEAVGELRGNFVKKEEDLYTLMDVLQGKNDEESTSM